MRAKKDEIFGQILAVRQNGLELLRPYADPADSQAFCALACEDLDDCFIKALNYELELNAFYENLTDNLSDENFKDVCFRLWATSNNEYIPALKARLAQILAVQFQGAGNASQEEQAQTAQNPSENILNALLSSSGSTRTPVPSTPPPTWPTSPPSPRVTSRSVS